MITLLIIDDEKTMLEFGKPFFERRGYTVLYAASGKEGLEIFKANRPDAVILDIGLPDMDGKEVLAKIKDFDKNSRVIVLTGFSEDEIKEKIIPLGPDAYFTKPCRLPLLAEQIEKWVKK